jgi:hypothetical protein
VPASRRPLRAHPALIPSDQLRDILATGPVVALINLFVHEGLEAFRERDVQGAHGRKSSGLAKIGKPVGTNTREIVGFFKLSISICFRYVYVKNLI